MNEPDAILDQYIALQKAFLAIPQAEPLVAVLRFLVEQPLDFFPHEVCAGLWLTHPAPDSPRDGPRRLRLARSAEREGIEPIATWRHETGRYNVVPLDEPLIGKVVGEKRLIGPRDRSEWDHYPEWARAAGIVSYLAAPLNHRDSVLGAIAIFSDAPNREQWRESRVLSQVLADYAAAAVANARAMHEIKRLQSRLARENAYLREEIWNGVVPGDYVGQGPAHRKVMELIELVAPTGASVLIVGETGTGKELIARHIHAKSRRRQRALIKVNCASIPHDLFESEFFGHVKGAFTGAVRDRIGRFQLANKGTLFLDEIGEIPLHSQGKLLRVLQEGEFERIGEDVTRRVNVRIIASTNRDLAREVDAGRFREDLYFRLNVFPIESVPLRDRVEDIPLLARHFLERSCRRLGVPRPVLEPRHLEQLKRYTWPGNVRELENIIERAVIYARGGPLRFDIPPSRPLPVRTIESALALEANAPRPAGAELVRYDQLKLLERESIEEALRRSGGKVYGPGGAAELLGIKASTLASRMKVLGIAKSR
jgi:transcriptional regulator with GAF, ATPase, and Fis domain